MALPCEGVQTIPLHGILFCFREDPLPGMSHNLSLTMMSLLATFTNTYRSSSSLYLMIVPISTRRMSLGGFRNRIVERLSTLNAVPLLRQTNSFDKLHWQGKDVSQVYVHTVLSMKCLSRGLNDVRLHNRSEDARGTMGRIQNGPDSFCEPLMSDRCGCHAAGQAGQMFNCSGSAGGARERCVCWILK